MMKRLPIIPTIFVLTAAAVMIALGIWQLGRAEEKADLIARYEAAQAEKGLPAIHPSSPEAAYTTVIEYCADPEGLSVLSGRNANGQSGWVHVARCMIGGRWPNTKEAHITLGALADHLQGRENSPPSDAELEAIIRDTEEVAPLDYVLEPADVVLGWSRTPDPVVWDGGFVAGTVVPTGELGFKIVADPPLAGLEPNAKPDPKDLPNNHLAYAGQWFFFALTALLIYGFAVRSRLRGRG